MALELGARFTQTDSSLGRHRQLMTIRAHPVVRRHFELLGPPEVLLNDVLVNLDLCGQFLDRYLRS